MPELPEVETVRQDILPFVKGRVVKRIEIVSLRNILKGVSPSRLKKELVGEKIVNLDRRAKYLIFKLASGRYFTIHLGMTGRVLFAPDDYVRVIFHLSGNRVLYYSDARRFGKIRFFKKYPDLKLGPEPLGRGFTPERFREMLKQRKAAIKLVLLDQKFLAGLGNIYVIESLFRAGINPKKPANKLIDPEIKRLYHQIKKVLFEALGYRGTSDSWFLDAHGKKGGFQLRLRVYGREGEPCFKCKTTIKRIVLGQRGTYFCPRCQK
jgi:formamidopyrimidine-DNA glycosylase